MRQSLLWLLFFVVLCARAGWAQQYQVSNLNDINLGSWSGSGNMTGNDPICVYKSSGGSAAFGVTGTDNSTITPGSFMFENAARTVQIPYALRWSNTATAGTGAMSDGVRRAGTGANRTSTTCGGTPNKNFSILVTSTNLPSVPAGTYTTTVSLMVGP